MYNLSFRIISEKSLILKGYLYAIIILSVSNLSYTAINIKTQPKIFHLLIYEWQGF